MSEAVDRSRINIQLSIPMVANQDIPVSTTSPVYVFFHKRKEAAQKYLEYDRPEAQEIMVDLIQMCNDSIKKYLGLI